jgi:S1-C subfamily serine protease
VFPGDILLSVGDGSVSSQEDYKNLMDKYEGQSVTIKLYRDGKTLSKKVKILEVPKNEAEGKP